MRTNLSLIKYHYNKVKANGGKPLPPLEINAFTPKKVIEEYQQETAFKTHHDSCAAIMKNIHYAESITVFCPVKAVPKELDFAEWVDFINRLGFPCRYWGTSTQRFDGSNVRCHSVNILPVQYPKKGNHIFVCHTLLRYAYSYKYKKIPVYTLDLFKTYKLDDWFCLYLGHYSEVNNSEYAGYYGMLPTDIISSRNAKFVYPVDVVGIMDMLHDKELNTVFKNEITKELPKTANGKIIPLKRNTYKTYFKHLGIKPEKR